MGYRHPCQTRWMLKMLILRVALPLACLACDGRLTLDAKKTLCVQYSDFDFLSSKKNPP